MLIDLEAIEELTSRATEGPWVSSGGTAVGATFEWVADCSTKENAAFIAAARELVPRLVAEVRAARSDVESYQRMFTRHDVSNLKHYEAAVDERIAEARRADAAEAEVRARDTVIEAVRGLHRNVDGDCAHCIDLDWDTPVGVPYPCETIRALEGATE